MKRQHNLLYKLLFVASFVLPFLFVATNLYRGTIPFWYDPARDLQMGLATHNKISLIGQTSGIPGIFYGPYWIWSLSITLLFSQDPRVVSFLVLTLPYFILFPLLVLMQHNFGILIRLLYYAYSLFIFLLHRTLQKINGKTFLRFSLEDYRQGFS